MTKLNLHRLAGSRLMAAFLGLGMLPWNAWAFYNPTSGRWLNRDPIEEKGGAGLYSMAGNNPICRSDPLGLRQFEWRDAVYSQHTEPGSWKGFAVLGETWWKEFDPQAQLASDPRGGCCKYIGFDGNYAQCELWWLKGDADAMRHEFGHVSQHFLPAFLAYKEEAYEYMHTCWRETVAWCLVSVITREMKEEYMYRAYRDGYQADCADPKLGNSDPNHPYCVEARNAEQAYERLRAAKSAALNQCFK